MAIQLPSLTVTAAKDPLTSSVSSEKAGLVEVIDTFIHRKFIDTDGMIPAIVRQFDRDENVATVQPLISWVDMDGNNVDRPELVNINVLSIGGGGFHISFPIKNGDLGWIFAADRDLSVFKQSLAMEKPPTGSVKTFEHGLFIPDVFRKYSVAEEDSGAMVIQATDGSTKIVVADGEIRVTAPSKVSFLTPLAEFSGDVAVAGTVTAAEAVIAGITISTHGHICSGPGNRTQNGMVE